MCSICSKPIVPTPGGCSVRCQAEDTHGPGRGAGGPYLYVYVSQSYIYLDIYVELHVMLATSKDRLHGTLDALILKTLSWGPRHGYAITRWLRDSSAEAIQ